MIGDELYVWQEQDQAGWSPISAPLVDDSRTHHHRTLIARHREGAEILHTVARRHQQAYRRPIRLAVFRDPVVLVVLGYDGDGDGDGG